MPKSVWDTAMLAVFERGITFRKAHNRWLCSTAVQPVCGLAPWEFASLSDFRPVLVRIAHPARPLTYILPQTTGRILDFQIDDAAYRTGWDRSSYNRNLQITNVRYCLGLLLHHCKRLTESYSTVLERQIPLCPAGVNRFFAAGEAEVFYAFDDAATAIIRTLDSLRPILWHGFGHSGQMPKDFRRTVSTASRLPTDVMYEIAAMQAIVDRAKEYRDCIQHYFSPGVHTDFVDVQRLATGFWTLTAWLPDNVETRSALQFAYDERIDALDFIWTALNRIACLFGLLAQHIAPE